LLFTSTCEPIGELSSLFDLEAFFLEREADLLDFDLLSFERDDEILLRVEVVDDESEEYFLRLPLRPLGRFLLLPRAYDDELSELSLE